MDESWERLGARGEVYRLLSRAYYTPEADFLKGEFSGLFLKVCSILALDSSNKEIEDMERYLESLKEPLELAVEYTRLFRGPVRAEAYPYESLYINGEIMGKSALNVVRCYREADVSVSGDFQDLPDHISVELEFMHYLCLQELEALQRGEPGEAARFRLMAQSFVKDHLGKWVPRFVDLVLECAKTPFYRGIARITGDFLSQEATTVSKDITA